VRARAQEREREREREKERENITHRVPTPQFINTMDINKSARTCNCFNAFNTMH